MVSIVIGDSSLAVMAQSAQPNRHMAPTAPGYKHKRGRHVEVRIQQCLNRPHGELSVDVARSQKNQSDQWLMLKDGQRPKVGVMGENDASPRGCLAEQFHVVGARSSAFNDVENVKTKPAQARDHVGIDIFVGQERELAEFQPPTSAVVRTSLRIAEAA